MANRDFISQFSYSFERQPVSLMAAITQSAGPVFTSNAARSGIVMTRISTGLYELTLADKYSALISADIMIQKASAADLQTQMVSSNVSTTKKLRFRTIAGASVTDLANGDVVYIKLVLRNSAS